MTPKNSLAARTVHRLEEGVVALLLAAMAILSFIQVVLRYVFEVGILWAHEATTYMFGWMVLLGISYGVRVGAHLGVDVVVKALPDRAMRVAAILGAVACMVYASLLLFGSYRYVMQMHLLNVEAEDMPIQKWLLLSVLPIGFALLLFRFIQALWRIAQGRQSGLGLADEASDSLHLLKEDAENRGDAT